MTPKNDIAVIGMACGRWYLKVAGITIAMETDPCRCVTFPYSNKWDKAMLKEACERINLAMREVCRDERS